jgi:hypothetical protein
MKKWLVLIFVLILILGMGSSAMAYTEGLLDGKTMTVGYESGGVNGGVKSEATDNNLTTYVALSNSQGTYSDTNVIWYVLSEPVTIDKYILKASGGVCILFFYDENGNEVSRFYADCSYNMQSITPVNNVKSIVLRNNYSQSGANIYEFDVFAAADAILSTPQNLVATPGNAQISLAWDAVTDATGYNIKRATTEGGPYTDVGSVTSAVYNYTDTSLTNGTTYYYVVTATNSGVESANSNEASATPQASLPNAPTSLVAAAGDSQVSLSWDAVDGATDYNIKRSTAAGGPYTTIATPNSPGYMDTGLTNGTTYYYVVTAVNADGESANSNEVSATPQTSGGTGTETGNAVLWVTMENGNDLNYDLSMDQVNAFINWYNSQATGVGQPYYCFSTSPISPYTSRTDYLIFDKIVCFKVNQY